MLTQERLREILEYVPATGLFRWLDSRHGAVEVGAIAGGVNESSGYIHIKIDGKIYQAQRLAVLYMVGAWPTHMVDHENGKRSDNSWLNLREATRAQNSQNATTYKNNRLGLKGVFQQRNGRFTARIKVAGKSLTIGTFNTAEDASAAYATAAVHHFGSFAKVA